GVEPGAADWAAAGDLAWQQADPEPDIHASADYRRHLVRVLTGRALREAAGRLAAEATEPEDDIHASAAYRRHLAGVLTARAARAAAAHAVSRLEGAA
ncbi:MAG: hypothetical protein ACJ75A_21935, partial [Actinomycetes bacterium]